MLGGMGAKKVRYEMEKVIYEFGNMQSGHYCRDTVKGNKFVRERLFNGSPAGAISKKITEGEKKTLLGGGKSARDLAEKLTYED